MTRTRRIASRKPRRGFTLIELLVVISIIAVLASLIAPAVQSARRTARKVQCLNSMRNVGLAMQNFSSANGGRLPGLWDVQQWPLTAGGTAAVSVPWPIQLLPVLDNGALLKNIRNDFAAGTAIGTVNSSSTVALEVLACPDHSTAYKKSGGLSYVLNSGYWANGNWSGAAAHTAGDVLWATALPASQVVGLATGVFFAGVDPANPPNSLDYVGSGDGTSSTIMISENLQAGPFYNAHTAGLGFGVQMLASPATAFSNYQSATSTFYLYASGAASLPPATFINNNSAAAAQYAAPRPSSNHAGGVNVIMCDGAGRFLTENIDKTVYCQLITSNGVSFGEQALNQASY